MDKGAIVRSLVTTAVGLAVLLGGAQLLVNGAITLARVFGLSELVIGITLVAVGTSLPELATSVVAGLRREADLVVGNIVGSNLFNILILVPEDLLFTSGPILSAASRFHALSAVSAMVMTGIVMVALLVRPRSSRFGGASLLLLAIYLVNSYLLYLYGE